MTRSFYDQRGRYAGHITGNGVIYNEYNDIVGFQYDDGRIYDANNNLAAKVDSEGRIWDGCELIAYQDGDILRSGATLIGSMPGAAPGQTMWYPGYGQGGSRYARSNFSLIELIGSLLELCLTIWPVIVASIVSALILLGLNRAAGMTGPIIAWVRPWLTYALAAGLVLVLFRRILARRDGWLLGLINILGWLLLCAAFTYVFLYELGLAALWAIPADFLTEGASREAVMGAFSACPPAEKIFSWYASLISKGGWLVLDQGVAGIFRSFEGLIDLCFATMSGLWPVLVVVLMIPVAIIVVVLAAFFLPILALLFPIILALLLCFMLRQILRLGLKKRVRP